MSKEARNENVGERGLHGFTEADAIYRLLCGLPKSGGCKGKEERSHMKKGRKKKGALFRFGREKKKDYWTSTGKKRSGGEVF